MKTLYAILALSTLIGCQAGNNPQQTTIPPPVPFVPTPTPSPTPTVSPTPTPNPGPLLVYVANNQFGTGFNSGWQGNLLAAGQAVNPNVQTGVQGADALCQVSPKCPANSTCKAIIVDGINRTALPESHDWVLRPNTEYINESGTVIGVTTESSVFSFNLTNYLGTPQFPVYYVWTGLNADWTTMSANTCNSWSSSSASLQGNAGRILAQDESAINAGNAPCDPEATLGLYCVQQPNF